MHVRGDLPPGANPDDLALATLAALHWGAASAGQRHGWRALSCGRAAILADLRGP
jgi:hypothetical protein